MPRKGPAPKRQILPDGRFNSKVLARFINKVMLRGKKSTAEHITYGALDIVAEKTGRDPMDIFTQALRRTDWEVATERLPGLAEVLGHIGQGVIEVGAMAIKAHVNAALFEA